MPDEPSEDPPPAKKPRAKWKPKPLPPLEPGAGPRLLTGGNPQIAKGDGEAPVQSYIAAMPGWKAEIGRMIDRLVVESVLDVQKAVRWNSPFYGVAGQGWFLNLHCVARYVKVSFLTGGRLVPPPPVASKVADVRYLHIFEGEPVDRDQLADWIRQAAATGGTPMF